MPPVPAECERRAGVDMEREAQPLPLRRGEQHVADVEQQVGQSKGRRLAPEPAGLDL